MTADLVAFLRARLDEDALWATEASRCGDSDAVPGGVHWQWEDADTDDVVVPDPGRDEYVDEDRVAVSLRSVEEFPTYSVGELPQFAISRAEQVPSAVGGHIARHDPARVLAEVAAKRAIVDHIADELDATDSPWWYDDKLTFILQQLALPYANHPDYRPEWAPDAA